MKRGLLLLVVGLVVVMTVSCFEGAAKHRGQGADADVDADTDTEKPPSPVQAIGYVGGRLFKPAAILILFSTRWEPYRFITTAYDVQVEVPGGDRLELAQGGTGHYAVSFRQDERMVYEPGGTYQFSFRLDDEEFAGPDYAGGYFAAEITAPAMWPSPLDVTEMPSGPGQPVTIAWSPSFPAGIYQVVFLGQVEILVTDTNFDFQEPSIDPPWQDALLPSQPTSFTIGGDAFPYSYPYTISYAGCAIEDFLSIGVSSDLGLHSGFLACSMAATEIEIP